VVARASRPSNPASRRISSTSIHHRLRMKQPGTVTPYGFGRDARNDGPEARSTHRRCKFHTIKAFGYIFVGSLYSGGTGVPPVKSGVPPDFVS
jgi:hypothetical protein